MIGDDTQSQSPPKSETQNTFSAPPPRDIASNFFEGQWNAGVQYLLNQVVSLTPADQYGSFAGPFYQVANQQPFSFQRNYQVGSLVQYNNNVYEAITPNIGVAPVVGANWVLAPQVGTNPVGSLAWVLVGNDLGNSQDLTSRYYWVYTYQHWVDLWNQTMLDTTQFSAGPGATSTCAYQDTYNALYAAYIVAGGVGGDERGL